MRSKRLIVLNSLLLCVICCSVSAERGSWNVTKQFAAGLTLLGISGGSPFDVWACGLNEATSANEIYYSNDGGTNWARQYSGMDLCIFMLDIKFLDRLNGWVAGGKMIGFPSNGVGAVTHDGGQTWTAIPITPFALIAMYQSVFALDLQHVYLTGMWGFDDSEGLKITTNGGATWTDHAISCQSGVRYSYFVNAQEGWTTCGTWPDDSTPTAIAAAADEPEATPAPPAPVKYKRFEHDPVGFDLPAGVRMTPRTGYIAEIYHTTDGGNTWNQQYFDQNHFYLNDLWFKNQFEGWVAAEADMTSVLLHTTDGGAHWNTVTYPSGNQHGLTDVIFTTMQEGWAFGMGSSGVNPATAIIHTTDAGVSWVRDPINVPAGIMYASFADQHRGWTAGGNNFKVSRVVRYDDGFYNQSPTPTGLPGSPTSTPPTPATLTPTPVGTGTPTKTNTAATHVPTATPSPASTATPEVTNTPGPTSIPDESGIYIYCNQTVYHPTEAFALWATSVNHEFYAVTADEYIALEVFGSYWWWPNWSSDIDSITTHLNPSYEMNDLILSFAWPVGIGAMDNIQFWAALVDQQTGSLFGNYSHCSFDFIE